MFTCSSANLFSSLHCCTLQDPAAEVRMKVASITEQVLTLVNKRLGLYRHMDEVVNRYKQTRDSGALNGGRKTLEADHRTLTNDINSLQARLKAEGSDLAEKVWWCFYLCLCVCVARWGVWARLRGFIYLSSW